MSRHDAYRTLRKARVTLTSVCLAAGLVVTGGCDRKESGQPTREKPVQAPTVCTTFHPTTYFAQRIGGDAIEVVCPCPADADPAFWMPDDETVQAYQRADLIVINGASFEKWLEKVALPEERIVDTAKPLADEFIHLEEAVTHTHGPEGEHSHEGIDGHTWLDPINAKTQAGEIKKALAAAFPEHEQVFETGYAALASDLDKLDARLKALAEKMGGRQLLASHPAYNYIGRRYGWQIKSFHLDPEAMPDEETFREMREFTQAHPAKYMLWESQPTDEIAAKVSAELGVENLVISPCEAFDGEELKAGRNYLSVMNENVDRLEKTFGG